MLQLQQQWACCLLINGRAAAVGKFSSVSSHLRHDLCRDYSLNLNLLTDKSSLLRNALDAC
jgi:hypothetical protein